MKLTGVLWASLGSGLILLSKAMAMLLAGQMPVAEAARTTGEEDTRLWRLIQRMVEAAHATKDWSHVRAIAIDDAAGGRPGSAPRLVRVGRPQPAGGSSASWCAPVASIGTAS